MENEETTANAQPNLFEFATKELSQDAFFAWLASWADPRYDDAKNHGLYRCAQDFVRLLLEQESKELRYLELKKVKAKLQEKRIDIKIYINDNLMILIEDKTFTGQHDEQLRRYKEEASKEGKQMICIYLKTGSEANASLSAVKEYKFHVIDRSTLIEFFDKHQKIESDIYKDFVSHIHVLDDKENQFSKNDIQGWEYDDWIGFYRLLESKYLKDHPNQYCDWGYRANAREGCLVFNWCWTPWQAPNGETYETYLEIEWGLQTKRAKLCFKIHGKKNTDVRNAWYASLMERCGEQTKIQKTNFHAGEYMAVAYVEQKDWLGENSLLDIDSVLQKLKAYEEFLVF
jgi:hypothetical protein